MSFYKEYGIKINHSIGCVPLFANLIEKKRVKQKTCGIFHNFRDLIKNHIMDSIALLSYFLPEGILNYFEVKSVNEASSKLVFVLEEKPLSVKELPDKHLHSKGFYPPVMIQDFPIRKRACYFEIKRRRWIEVDTGLPYSRAWDLIAKGTKMTSEFALFLNKLDR